MFVLTPMGDGGHDFKEGTIIKSALGKDNLYHIDYGSWFGLAKYDEQFRKDFGNQYNNVMLEVSAIFMNNSRAQEIKDE